MMIPSRSARSLHPAPLVLAFLLAACGGDAPDGWGDIMLASNPPTDFTVCDEDGDGMSALSCGGLDCADFRPDIYAGAPEIPNDGIDQDCNGIDLVICDLDEDGVTDPFCGGTDCDPKDPLNTVPTEWYGDADGDGFHSFALVEVACFAPEGFARIDTPEDEDCDDTRATTFPGAQEICGDGLDNGCDGSPVACDDIVPPTKCDADGDRYLALACGGTDCADDRPDINPGAIDHPNDGIDQTCDGVDATFCDLDEDGVIDAYCMGPDCDSTDDEIGGPYPWFPDADGDGFSDGTAEPVLSCGLPDHSPDGLDCDDTTNTAYPGAAEVCGDGIDNGCDGVPAECDPALVLPVEECFVRISGGGLLDFGRTLVTSVDFNGNGSLDLVIGARDASGADVVVLVDGAVRGDYEVRSDARTLHVFEGFDFLGAGAAAGDFNGDGSADLALGAPEEQDPNTCAPPGAAYVFSGPFTGTAWTAASPIPDATPQDGLRIAGVATSEGAVAGGALCHADGLGWRVAAAQLDGVGGTDLVLGTSWSTTTFNNLPAAAFLSPLPASGTPVIAADVRISQVPVLGAIPSHLVVAPAGDINGDGNADLMLAHLGDPAGNESRPAGQDAGRAWFFYGPFGTNDDRVLATADATLSGVRAGQFLGVSAGQAMFADVNGDGIDDILVGEHGGEGGQGAVRLYLGPISGDLTSDDADAVWTGQQVGDLAGDGAFAGDVNGDGATDLVIGAQHAPWNGADSGAAYVVLGPLTQGGSLDSAAIVYTGPEGSLTGTWVQPMGDLNGDGRAEVAIASPHPDDGHVYVCRGRR